MIAQFNLQSLAAIADGESQSQKPIVGAADRTLFELRKKKFNADFFDWFALQNEHFEAHDLWCDGLVPWMSANFDSFSAD